MENQLLELVAAIESIRVDSEKRSRANHERFNVFTTLLKAEDEIRLHTRFLHCLLDPQGGHDCGALFLNLFLDTLSELPGEIHNSATEIRDPFPPRDQTWITNKEPRTAFGQIDLLLSCPAFVIAIENKINAHEQRNQLLSYASHLNTQQGRKTLLIYLTLHGKKSDTAGNAPYLAISYSKQILHWLDKCLHASQEMAPIHQVILQYQKVVRQLTGITLESKSMKSIVEIIRKNPDIIRFREEIQNAVEETIKDGWDSLASGIMTDLAKDFTVSLDSSTGRFGDGNLAALIIEPPAGSPSEAAQFSIRAERYIGHFGIGPYPGDHFDNLSAVEETLFSQMYALMSNHPDPNLRPGGKSQRFPVGWLDLMNCTTGEDFLMLVTRPEISGICNNIRAYVKALEEILMKCRP